MEQDTETCRGERSPRTSAELSAAIRMLAWRDSAADQLPAPSPDAKRAIRTARVLLARALRSARYRERYENRQN